jgi:DNA polymerase
MLVGEQYPAGIGLSTVLADMDFEIYSEAGYRWDDHKEKWVSITSSPPHGLGAVGAAVYAEHPSTEVLCLVYDLKDGRGKRIWVPGMPPPIDLFEHIKRGGLIEAWNSSFEFYIWNLCCVKKYGFPPLPLEQTRDAAAKARLWGLPGALGKAAKAIKSPVLKDEDGTRLLNKFSKPQNPTKKRPTRRVLPKDDLPDFAKLCQYCVGDVDAETNVSLLTPDLPPEELDLWITDQRINTRGVYVDRDALNDCLEIVRQATVKYTEELRELTGGAVKSHSEVAGFQRWLLANGHDMDNMQKDTVAAALEDPLLNPRARRALEIRSALSSAAVLKLKAIKRRLCSDGRLRDMFLYSGATRTSRWAGRGPQPQNLKSGGPKRVKEWNIEAVEAALVAISKRDLDYLELLYGDALETVAGCIRALFCAAPGMELISSDFSAIEAVVNAALSGEQWRLEVFHTHGKIYETSASKITGMPLEEMLNFKRLHGRHHEYRKLGKTGELASQYQGWVGAWKAFGADKHFPNDDQIKQAILAWRRESPMIEEFWGGQYRKHPERWEFTQELFGVEGCVVAAILDPGQVFGYRMVSFFYHRDVLYCRVPSGKYLAYHQPRLYPTEHRLAHRPSWKITYMGYNTDSSKGAVGWVRLESWGGKFVENIVQKVARDIMANAIQNVERSNYPVVLHVHDETVSEVPDGFGSIEEYENLLMLQAQWFLGWPIKAAGGWRGRRFRKD